MTDSSPPEVLKIQRLAPGGEGVARRSNGEVVFVAGAVPGDLVEVGSIMRSGGALRGQLLSVAAPSVDRREAPCSYAGECGGCDFMQLRPEAQRQAKLSILLDALKRIGGDPPRPADIQFVAAATSSRRSRLRLHVSGDGTCGMFSARSHRVVPVAYCLVSDERINGILSSLSQLDDGNRKRLSFCEQIELRSAEYAPQLAVRLFPRKGIKLRTELYAQIFPSDALLTVVGSTQDDEQTQLARITEEISIPVPLSGFSQVRADVNQQLVEAVVRVAELRNHRTFLDAYAGAGNFTIPLLCAGLEGRAVDVWGPSIIAARATARDLGLPFTGFDIGDARTMLEHLAKAKRQFDYIILDPPRHGAKSVLEVALRLKPRTLALVACDPVSLARELGTLTAKGARIGSLTMFDMFPETHHCETLAVVDCIE
ncbi:MAG TPA: hypothetical protein VKP30_16595 [Polyangiaceae bacterium]|nr:hypothetical protein [Polyangiaceae bacterium]